MKFILSFLFFLIISIPAYAGFYDLTQSQPYLYKFTSTASASSTLVKSGAGILHTLTVTGGTASAIDIYDGTSSAFPEIASFTSTSALQTYTFDIGFSSACTVSTSSNLKYTVSYL